MEVSVLDVISSVGPSSLTLYLTFFALFFTYADPLAVQKSEKFHPAVEYLEKNRLSWNMHRKCVCSTIPRNNITCMWLWFSVYNLSTMWSMEIPILPPPLGLGGPGLFIHRSTRRVNNVPNARQDFTAVEINKKSDAEEICLLLENSTFWFVLKIRQIWFKVFFFSSHLSSLRFLRGWNFSWQATLTWVSRRTRV